MAQVESSSLGGISVIVDILQGVDSGLVLKNFTDHKENMMSIEIIPTNNNILFIESIDLNARMWDIHKLLPTEMPLVFDNMNPLVF